MKQEYIKITTQDLEDYYKTLSNKCAIRKIRFQLINRMPVALRTEFKTRKNDLICVNEVEGKYQFHAWEASLDLKAYLTTYVLINLTK